MTAAPPVPASSGLKPSTMTWREGQILWRVFTRSYGATGFNPTPGVGRFRPIHDASGATISTVYVASDEETALAEGPLRGVDRLARGAPMRLYTREIAGLAIVRLRLLRTITSMRMHGSGLVRLKLLAEHVTHCPPVDYPYTAEWAQALHDCPTPANGIEWTSKRNDSARAAVLWGDSVSPDDLEVDGAEVWLDREPGLERVRMACAAAEMDLEG